MKNIIRICTIALVVLAGLVSCKKDQNKVFFDGGTAPVLSASRTGSIPLSFANKDMEAIKLTWTNPNYMFTTGLSSQDVSYSIEIDTTGANFTNPKKQTVNISQNLTKSFTQSEFNEFMLNQLLVPGISHNIEIRVKSTLINSTVPLYSNVMKFTVTPYDIPPKVEPPAAGNLWIVGDATPNGWSNPLQTAYKTSHKFTKVSNTLYELTIALPGGGGYKLIQEDGVWSSQYHMLAGGTWEGGDFEKRDSDPQFPGPPGAGNYKITVNFQTGKFSATKL